MRSKTWFTQPVRQINYGNILCIRMHLFLRNVILTSRVSQVTASTVQHKIQRQGNVITAKYLLVTFLNTIHQTERTALDCRSSVLHKSLTMDLT